MVLLGSLICLKPWWTPFVEHFLLSKTKEIVFILAFQIKKALSKSVLGSAKYWNLCSCRAKNDVRMSTSILVAEAVWKDIESTRSGCFSIFTFLLQIRYLWIFACKFNEFSFNFDYLCEHLIIRNKLKCGSDQWSALHVSISIIYIHFKSVLEILVLFCNVVELYRVFFFFFLFGL